MDTITRVREYLKTKYNITTDEELWAALENQKQLNIGIFVSPCGMEAKADDKKIS